MRILITGAPGAGKSTLAGRLDRIIQERHVGSKIVSYDMDTFGYHVRAAYEDGHHFVVPRHTIRKLLEDPRDVWCFGLCNNIYDDVVGIDARGEVKNFLSIDALQWDRKYVIVWDPHAEGEYDRRFTQSRMNRYGKDLITRAKVIRYARDLYDYNYPGDYIRLDATGQASATTMAHLTALVLAGGKS